MAMTDLELVSADALIRLLRNPEIRKGVDSVLNNVSFGYPTNVDEVIDEAYYYSYGALCQEIVSSFVGKEERTAVGALRRFTDENRKDIAAAYDLMEKCRYDKAEYTRPDFEESWNDLNRLAALTDTTRFYGERILTNILIDMRDAEGIGYAQPLENARKSYSFDNGTTVVIKNHKGVETFQKAVKSLAQTVQHEMKQHREKRLTHGMGRLSVDREPGCER